MTSNVKHITVLYFAALQEAAKKAEETLAIATETTLSTLYQQVAQQYSVDLPIERVRVAKNHQFCDWDESFADGDVIAFIPPVAGG